MRALALLPAAALIAGCGLRAPLEPPPGEPLPPAPAMADRPLTSEELLAPPPIARPERVDELLRRSEERESDRFDLPPPGVATGVVAPPEARRAADPDDPD